MATNGNGAVPPTEVIFGQSHSMAEIREQLALCRNLAIPILIQGESGTGKEIIARLIASGDQLHAPFVKVNCPAIPAALLETELFGYEKGAFTGAHSSKRGRVELADKGVLFLDEIGELDVAVQAKLVQLLQDGTYGRVGGQEERKVHLRVVCATNRDLKDQIARGLFRSDLYYRVNALTIKMPALRDRIVDLPILVEFFLDHYSRCFERSAPAISADTLRIMQHYHWPGNIRELENLVRRHVILQDEEAIVSEMMGPTDGNFVAKVEIDTTMPLKRATKRAIRDLERQVIMRMLQINNWNRKKTADALEISYRGLLYKMRDAGFPRIPDNRPRTADDAD